MICFFARFGWGDCDGRIDRCHLIPKQRIAEVARRRRVQIDAWDDRLIVPGCRGHHHLFDAKLRRLTLPDFPPQLLAWAQEHRFYFDEGRSEWKGLA